jgi:hypothetical protein
MTHRTLGAIAAGGPNDEVERCGGAQTTNEADLSRSSTPSLAHRRRHPAIARRWLGVHQPRFDLIRLVSALRRSLGFGRVGWQTLKLTNGFWRFAVYRDRLDI